MKRHAPPTDLTPCRLYLAAANSATLNVVVASFKMASLTWQKYRNTNGLGPSTMKRRCGRIYATDGEFLAYVSYNGRVWGPKHELIQEAASFSRYAKRFPFIPPIRLPS